jgi:hypothetical protein
LRPALVALNGARAAAQGREETPRRVQAGPAAAHAARGTLYSIPRHGTDSSD